MIPRWKVAGAVQQSRKRAHVGNAEAGPGSNSQGGPWKRQARDQPDAVSAGGPTGSVAAGGVEAERSEPTRPAIQRQTGNKVARIITKRTNSLVALAVIMLRALVRHA